jgi:hypothetical protein
MESLDWIKSLIEAEQKMEDAGVVDLSTSHPEAFLEDQTSEFLHDIKAGFVSASATFNQLKGSNLGTLKIYAISNTKSDFMLFRNGYKLIFAMKRPGEIEVYHSLITTHYINPSETETESGERDSLRAQWGAFGEVSWMYRNLPVKIDFLVRHYMTRFIRESAK